MQSHTGTVLDTRCGRAAVVVYRVRKGRVEFLLVSRSSDRKQFVLPGGKADAGESLRRAARRECLEESGVGVRVLGVLTEFDHFNRRGEVKPTRVYLAGASSEMPSPEGREVVWARYGDLVDCVYDVPGPTLEVLGYAAECLEAERVAA